MPHSGEWHERSAPYGPAKVACCSGHKQQTSGCSHDHSCGSHAFSRHMLPIASDNIGTDQLAFDGAAPCPPGPSGRAPCGFPCLRKSGASVLVGGLSTRWFMAAVPIRARRFARPPVAPPSATVGLGWCRAGASAPICPAQPVRSALASPMCPSGPPACLPGAWPVDHQPLRGKPRSRSTARQSSPMPLPTTRSDLTSAGEGVTWRRLDATAPPGMQCRAGCWPAARSNQAATPSAEPAPGTQAAAERLRCRATRRCIERRIDWARLALLRGCRRRRTSAVAQARASPTSGLTAASSVEPSPSESPGVSAPATTLPPSASQGLAPLSRALALASATAPSTSASTST